MATTSKMMMMKDMLVLELCSVLAGPSVCQFCAELGARVVKVESTLTEGDVTRTWKMSGEVPTRPTLSAYFSSCNVGKRSIGINLQSEKGLGIVHGLAKKADLVVASYKPGDARKLKVDAKTLRGMNSRLIYAEISGYGEKNPRAGYDAIIQAETGFQYMNGSPDSLPTKMPIAFMDLLAAHQLKQAILLALWERDKTGVGTHVQVSLFQAGVSSLANQGTGYLVGKKIPTRIGSDHPSISPYGTLFKTKDGKELVPAIGTDRQFALLCKVLGEESLAKDPAFSKNENRVLNRVRLTEKLQKLIGNWERDKLLQELEKLSIPAGAVNNLEDVFKIPLAQELVIRSESGTPVGLRQIAFSPHSNQAVDNLRLEPPGFGEHTKEILNELLQMDSAEVDSLAKEGVVFVDGVSKAGKEQEKSRL